MTSPGLRDPQQVGDLLARSGFFSDSRDAAQAAVKVMAGAELGFPPVASMTGVFIVKGKVTLSANLMAAAIKRFKRDGRHPYTFRLKEHTAQVCSIDFLEDGEVIGNSSFSMEEAQNAGLTGSDPWRKFPKSMLFARALSNGAKWHCPDVFGGPIYTPDEFGVDVDEEGQPTDPTVGGPRELPQLEPAEPEPVAEPALTDDAANAKREQARALFEAIEGPEYPRALFDRWLGASEHSHERLDALVEFLRGKQPGAEQAA